MMYGGMPDINITNSCIPKIRVEEEEEESSDKQGLRIKGLAFWFKCFRCGEKERGKGCEMKHNSCDIVEMDSRSDFVVRNVAGF